MNGFAPLLAVLALAQAEGGAPAAADPAATEGAAPAPSAPAAEPPPRPAPRETPPAPAPRPRVASPPAPAPAAPAVAPTAPVAPARGASPPEAERVQVARAALAFLDALVAADADALAAASAERFSFDGDVRAGRDGVRRRWRELLARRDAAPAALLDLELLPAPDAVARLGPPPPRVAPLAARGAWVGIADLSGRPVVLFLVREGSRWTVAGLHD